MKGPCTGPLSPFLQRWHGPPMTADFLIVGGGIAGISAAARLAPLGSVVLCEAEAALGYHASGRSAALYEPRYGKPPVVALSEASGDYLRHAHGGVLSPRGLLLVGRADEAAAFEADRAAFGLDRIGTDEARALIPILNPDVVAMAAHHDGAEDIDTDRLMQDFARTARASGAEILTGAAVRAIRRDGGLWRVEAGERDLKARVLVNAAGAWADGIAGMAGVQALGLTPYRRSVARIPAPGGHDLRHWPILFGPGESWYAKPDAGKLIVSPADEDPAPPHDAWADDMVLAEGLARYEAYVTEAVTRVESNWAGLRTFAPDRVLAIGRDPVQPDFFWLAGQGGYGFQTSAGASLLAADLLAGRTPALDTTTVAALDPGRFG